MDKKLKLKVLTITVITKEPYVYLSLKSIGSTREKEEVNMGFLPMFISQFIHYLWSCIIFLFTWINFIA